MTTGASIPGRIGRAQLTRWDRLTRVASVAHPRCNRLMHVGAQQPYSGGTVWIVAAGAVQTAGIESFVGVQFLRFRRFVAPGAKSMLVGHQ